MIDCGLPILKKYLKKCIRDNWKKNNLFISLIISKIKLKLFLTFETVVDVCCSTIDLKKKVRGSLHKNFVWKIRLTLFQIEEKHSKFWR